MSFTNRITVPIHEKRIGSNYLEVTQGCSHDACTFCTYYKLVDFKAHDEEWIRRSLEPIARSNQRVPVKRIFLQGADPFVLSYDRLMRIAEIIHESLPTLDSIGAYARITNMQNKTVDQLSALSDAGYADIFVGIETADDELLRKVNKGFDRQTIIEQGSKLRESGLTWYSSFLLGLGGHGFGLKSAEVTADAYNIVQPQRIAASSLTLVHDRYTRFVSQLEKDMRSGEFVEATEQERYEELRRLIELLEYPVLLDGNHPTIPITIFGRLPEEKGRLLGLIDGVLDGVPEKDLHLGRQRVFVL